MTTPRAKYEIWAEDKTAQAWKSALDNAKGFTEELKSTLLPIASGAALAGFITSSLSAADAVGDAAERAGALASEMSRMNFIAEQSDTSFETLESGVKNFHKTLSNAAAGEKTAADALDAIGISADQLRGKGLEEQFAVIADGFASVKDPADRTRLAMEIFGKSGNDLIPLLNKGSEGIRMLAHEADALGITLDDRATQSIDRATKSLDKFWSAARGQTANYFGGVIGAIQDDTRSEIEKLQDTLHHVESIRDSNNDAGMSSQYQLARRRGYNDEISQIEEQIRILQVKGGIDASTNAAAAAGQRDVANATKVTTEEFVSDIEARIAAEEKQAKANKDHLELSANADEYTADLHAKFKEYYDAEYQLSISATEREALQLKRRLDANELMLAKGVKLEEKYEKDREAIYKEGGLAEIDINAITSRDITDLKKEDIVELTEFEKKAQANAQDIIANMIIHGFDDGINGALKSFARMLLEMEAQALAADWAKDLFPGEGGGLLGRAGQFGLDVLGSVFSGHLAKGGPIEQNKWYIAGEHGPEPIWGGGSGAFAVGYGPGASGGGAITINTTFNNTRDLTDQKMAIYAKQISDVTIARIRDDRRRGKP